MGRLEVDEQEKKTTRLTNKRSLTNCSNSTYYHSAPKVRKIAKPDASNKHAKPTGYNDTITGEAQSELRATIEMLAQAILECKLSRALPD